MKYSLIVKQGEKLTFSTFLDLIKHSILLLSTYLLLGDPSYSPKEHGDIMGSSPIVNLLSEAI